MEPFPYRLVTVDIDGTLTLAHGWALLARRLGRTAEYDQTQKRFQSGAIGEDEHLRNLIAISEGVSEAQLATLLEETPRVAGIAPGVERLHELGAKVALLTHNPGFVTDWYVQEFRMDGADGLSGGPMVSAGVVGKAGRVRSDKLGGLDRLCARFGVGRREVAHVGDGRADALVFPLVALGVAFGSLLPDVRAAADVVVGVPEFREVVRVLERTPPARR